MKITKLLIAGVLALSATVANSTTILAPTDGDVNFPTLFSNIAAGLSLYMFDDSDLTDADKTAALAASGPDEAMLITLGQVVGIAGPNGGGDYTATNASTAQAIFLTGSDQFILALYDVANTAWISDTGVSGDANTLYVNFGNYGTLAADVKVIPVPAAAWLFGSGLIGLVGIARRRV